MSHAAENLAQPLCLFEDSEARPGDPWLSRMTTRLTFYGEEVYHLAQSCSSSDIEDAVNWSESSWQLVAAVNERAVELDWTLKVVGDRRRCGELRHSDAVHRR
jgi:hypothetical protein